MNLKELLEEHIEHLPAAKCNQPRSQVEPLALPRKERRNSDREHDDKWPTKLGDDEETRAFITQQIVDRGYVRAKPTREELARDYEEEQKLAEANANHEQPESGREDDLAYVSAWVHAAHSARRRSRNAHETISIRSTSPSRNE